MFFFLLGAKPRLSDAEHPERRVLSCPACLGTRSFDRRRARTWLELFFLPVVPLGGGREVFVCASCGLMLDTEVAEMRGPSAIGTPVPPIESTHELHCLHCGAAMTRPRHPGWRTLRCDACGRSFEARVD